MQALLLYNIGDKELTAGELRTRGYYLGSNVSYNLKKLVEMGFLTNAQQEQQLARPRKLRRGAEAAVDLVELVAELGFQSPANPVRLKVAYHDACHLVHGQKVRSQPRELLRRIPGLTVILAHGGRGWWYDAAASLALAGSALAAPSFVPEPSQTAAASPVFIVPDGSAENT